MRAMRGRRRMPTIRGRSMGGWVYWLGSLGRLLGVWGRLVREGQNRETRLCMGGSTGIGIGFGWGLIEARLERRDFWSRK